MTIIVWDGEVLATDKLAVRHGIKIATVKAFYSQDETGKCILSGVGDLDKIAAACQWYESGADPHNYISRGIGCTLIVVDALGLKFYEHPWIATKVGYGKCAFGSGADISYGALAMGASAERAVECANEYALMCGMGIDTYKI